MKTTLKSTFCIFLMVSLCMTLIGTAIPAFARPASDQLSEKVDAYITETMRRLPIPGIAVGIVKGDQVLCLKGYGTANANGDPVTPQTPFMIGSVTKTFTALAVHQLVNAGKINLDAPVQTYIPEFHLANQNALTLITVRQLFKHTSGIPTLEGDELYLNSPKATFDDAIKKLAQFKPIYKPGEHQEYSNWNYVLLGEIIARASGKPYSEYVKNNILKSLEMTRADFVAYDSLPGAATGNLIVFGVPVPYKEKYIPAIIGASNLSASAEEMTHYLVAYFNQGRYHDHSLLPAQGQGWYDDSWNWHVGSPDDSLYNSFSGSHIALQANISIFPQQKVGVVVLMNTRLEQLSPAAPGAWNIAFNIAQIAMGAPYVFLSNQGFYITWVLIDGFLFILIVSIIWQAFKLKNWRNQYRAKGVAAWFGIAIDFLLCFGILVFPNLVNSRWNILLFHRPDFAIPILAIGLCLGVLAFIKVITSKP